MRKKEDLRIIKTKASLGRGLLNMMKNKSFEDIKISEICKESQVNRSTFYDHFNDKYELLESLMEDMRKDLTQKISISPKYYSIKTYYIELMKILLKHIENNKEIYSSVAKINNNSIAKDMMIDEIITAATRETDSNYINNSSIPTRTIILYYASGIINITIEALNKSKEFDIDELINIIDELTPSLDCFIAIKK